MTEPCETIQAFAKAMAKFTPKKVILSLDTWRCPHCGHFVATNPPMIKANFCSDCGLGLEWPALTNFEKVTESIDALAEYLTAFSADVIFQCRDKVLAALNITEDEYNAVFDKTAFAQNLSEMPDSFKKWLESEVDHE